MLPDGRRDFDQNSPLVESLAVTEPTLGHWDTCFQDPFELHLGEHHCWRQVEPLLGLETEADVAAAVVVVVAAVAAAAE